MESKKLEAIRKISAEVDRAEKLHPRWPDDIIHAVGIIVEEAGETMQAALNHIYFGEDREKIRTEAIQTAATCIRLLKNMP
tara:strand:+ start:2404 stop:2646 length:243 start_codon:yes stop_codon:yes gene_type:complete